MKCSRTALGRFDRVNQKGLNVCTENIAILGGVVPSLQNLFSLMHPGSLSLLMKASKHERGVDCIMLLLTVAC